MNVLTKAGRSRLLHDINMIGQVYLHELYITSPMRFKATKKSCAHQ